MGMLPIHWNEALVGLIGVAAHSREPTRKPCGGATRRKVLS